MVQTTFVFSGGEKRAAACPLIVSASRATDLPAFHDAWFMNRLRAGYCARINPFNGKPGYISFSCCRAIVFWSKNPTPLLPRLGEISDMGFQFYFNFTLNDYEREGLEKNIPPLEERVDVFVGLSERIGRERVIWRFDPIIFGPGLGPDEVLRRIERLGRILCRYTEKLVFSFVEISGYKKVRRKLGKNEWREPDGEEKLFIAAELARMNAGWEHPLVVAACAQDVDLSQYGIISNKCVDGELVCRLCPGDLALYGIAAKRDLGQRKTCGCAPSRDIGTYDSCGHLCAYCYALSSDGAYARFRGDADREFL